jgi:hypothetical protein
MMGDQFEDSIVGTIELTRRLGVKLSTGHAWRARDLLPPADYASINGHPAWAWSTIVRWANDTGRLAPENPVTTDYALLTGKRPSAHHPRGPRPEATE